MYNKTVIFTNAVDNRRTASKVLAIQQDKVIFTNAVDNRRTASKVLAIQQDKVIFTNAVDNRRTASKVLAEVNVVSLLFLASFLIST